MATRCCTWCRDRSKANTTRCPCSAWKNTWYPRWPRTNGASTSRAWDHPARPICRTIRSPRRRHMEEWTTTLRYRTRWCAISRDARGRRPSCATTTRCGNAETATAIRWRISISAFGRLHQGIQRVELALEPAHLCFQECHGDGDAQHHPQNEEANLVPGHRSLFDDF